MGKRQDRRSNRRIEVAVRTGDVALSAVHDHYRRTTAYQVPAIDGAGALTSLGDVGAGSLWRRFLLGSVAAGSLFLYGGRRAEAQCVVAAPTVNCTGNLAAGVSYNGVALITTLDVNNLTANIAPAAGTTGINFLSTGAATLTSNTTPFNITTTGLGNGIVVRAAGANAASVTHTGNISAGRQGVYAGSATGAVTVNTAGTIAAAARVGIFTYTGGAGAVMVTHTGNITAGRYGVYAYSIGGGITVNTTGTIVAMQRDGIYAGDDGAGAVMVTHTGGNITSAQSGVRAQSDAGGVTVNTTGNITATGGLGIFAYDAGAGAVSVTHTGGDITATAAGVYGSSAGGGVTVSTTGNITATGAGGIEARDTGVGAVSVIHTGGNIMAAVDGVLALSAGGGVTVNTTGNITSATKAGIFANDSLAGAVMVTHTGNVTAVTQGIYAVSVGGGVTVSSIGDITSASSRGIFARDTSTGSVGVTHTGDINANSIGVYAYSAGGGVTVNTTGNISSTNSNGIFARDSSIGAVSVTHTGGDINAASTGVIATATGGGVTVNTTGNITSTAGRGIGAQDFSTGAVSVTHTGGDINAASTGVVALSAGGSVTVNTTGNITSTTRFGIFAGEFGAGAVMVTHTGNITSNLEGVSAYSTGAVVKVTTTGNITSTTQEAIETINATGNGTVSIVSGTVTGPLAGVQFTSNAATTNTLNNGGTVTSAGTAVIGGAGNETVKNTGTVTGNVNLGAGTNAFNNLAGATFNSGATVVLGAGNTLNNAGELSPLGLGTVGTTALSSNFVQTAAGNTTVDINAGANTADQITATNITVAGTVTVNLVNVAPVTNQTVTIATSTNAITNNLPSLISPPAVQGQLVVNANNIQITYSVSFLGFGGLSLTPNQMALAGYINQIAGTGGAALSTVLTALANLPAGAYQKALNQLGAESFTNLNFAALLSSLTNTNNLFSCPVMGGALAYIKEGECLWVRPQARDLRVGNKASNPGFRQTSGGVSAGAQVALSKDKRWHVGFSAGYQGSTLDQTGLGVTTRGDTAHGGVVLKYQWGATLVSAGISGGLGWFENTRAIAFTGFGATARSSFTQAHVTGRLWLSHLFRRRKFYLKPRVDFDVTWLRRSAFTETGAAGANLAVAAASDVNFSVSPALEIGTQYKIRDEITIRPYLRGGLTAFTGNQHTVNASFAAAPAATGFSTTTRFDRLFATVAFGAVVYLTDPGKQGMLGTVTLRVEYIGRFSQNSRGHAISAKFSFKF